MKIVGLWGEDIVDDSHTEKIINKPKKNKIQIFGYKDYSEVCTIFNLTL